MSQRAAYYSERARLAASRSRWAGQGLLIAALFPFVTPVPTPFDTQPYTAVVAAVIILARLPELSSLPGVLLLAGLVVPLAVVSWLVYGASSSGFRSVFGYFSVFVISVAMYVTATSLAAYIVPFAAAVWLAFAAVQQFVDPAFGTFLVPRMSTSVGRGVTGLSVEPSIFAITSVFMLLLNDYFLARQSYSRRVWLSCSAIIGAQLVLASSALGYVLLVAYLISRAIAAGNAYRLFLAAGATGAVVLILSWLYTTQDALRGSRVGQLLGALTSQPLSEFFYSDASVAQRAFAVMASHESLLYSFGLGYGVGTWTEGVPQIVSEGSDSLRKFGVNSVGLDRIMSGFGSALYELGLFGLLIPTALALATVYGWSQAETPSLRRWCLSAGVTSGVIMETAIPLAFPLFGVVFGLIVCSYWSRDRAPDRFTDGRGTGQRGS